MSQTNRTIGGALEPVAELFHHAIGDRRRAGFDYDRLIVVDNGRRGFDIVLRLDGGYTHPRDAEAARLYCQQRLDAVLDLIEDAQ